jgi:DNA-binding NtrC family response regulator
VIERAVIFGEGPFVRASDIMIEEYKEARPLSSSLKAAKAKAVAQIERTYLEEALRANQGNITKAAQHAQMNRRVFWELLRKHKINLQGP